MRGPYNVGFDQCDSSGAWLNSWTGTDDDGEKIRFRSLSGSRWNALNRRCLPGGYVQGKRPRYIGAKNNFCSFNEFAEWSSEQIGYMEKDDLGNFWQLDKDLLVPGNRIYSMTTCMFVPARVNSFFLASNSVLGDYHLGVSFNKRKRCFVSQCNNANGVPVHLGCFPSQEDAHEAWKEFKSRRCLELSSEFTNTHPVLHETLVKWAGRLSQEGVFCP